MKVYDRVTAVLAECLGIERAAIRPNSHLENDLGVESIDLLDILFRLEDEFDVRMEREELFPDFLFTLNSNYVVDGELTDSGRAESLKFFPFLTKREVAGLRVPKSLLTVKVLVGSVAQQLKAKSPKGGLKSSQECSRLPC